MKKIWGRKTVRGHTNWLLIKDLTTVKQGKATTVQDRSGKCLTEERQTLEMCLLRGILPQIMKPRLQAQVIKGMSLKKFMHGLTFMAYDTERPTMPGLRSSRPNTAKSEANKIMQLPTNSSRMASHLKHIKHYYTVKKQKRNIRLEEVIQFTKSCNIHLYNYMHARTNACI